MTPGPANNISEVNTARVMEVPPAPDAAERSLSSQAPVTMEKRTYYYTLDIVRAIAAFFVVLQHTRNMVLVDYKDAGSLNPFWKLLYMSNFGHQAVIVFFVLSGCVVGKSVVNAVERNTWSWKGYVFDRMSRLWVVLLPALVMTVFWDHLSLSYTPDSSFVHTGNGFGHMITEPLADSLTWTSFFGNAFFVQTILVEPFGSNGPLWSLAYEFWYYLVFPLFYVALVRPGPILIRGALLLAGVCCLAFVGARISMFFLVWLMGVVAYLAYRKFTFGRLVCSFGMAGSTLLLVALVGMSRFGLTRLIVGHFIQDVIIGIAAALVVCFGLSVQPPALLCRLGAFFSSFSYSLYVLHAPALTCIIALWFQFQSNADRLQPSFSVAAMLTALLGALYLYSYLLFLVFENRTAQLRRWYKR